MTATGWWSTSSQGTERKNRVFLKDLQKPGSPVVPLFDQVRRVLFHSRQ